MKNTQSKIKLSLLRNWREQALVDTLDNSYREPLTEREQHIYSLGFTSGWEECSSTLNAHKYISIKID